MASILLVAALVGAQSLCIRPTSTTSTVEIEHDLSLTAFNVSTQCVENYYGVASAAPCLANGEPYRLTTNCTDVWPITRGHSSVQLVVNR